MPYISTYDNEGNLLKRREIIVPLGLYKNQMINGIRSSCSCSIQSAGLDEATQQNAALGIYQTERCEAIKSYIAACRNEYLRCKELIMAAQTNEQADAVQFVAPPVPEGM